MNIHSIFTEFAQLGFLHVIPFGFDHILFILALLLFSSSFKTVLIHCSIFTIAHSLAMVIATIGIIVPNPNYVEPLIAISIVYAAIENIMKDKPDKFRIFVIFFFGIIHGLGFASASNEIGLPQHNFVFALFAFNVGVEIGQITVILVAFIGFVYWCKDKSWYKNKIVYPISTLIGSIALVMAINRLMEIL